MPRPEGISGLFIWSRQSTVSPTCYKEGVSGNSGDTVRSAQTIILRILIDSETPRTLRGTLHCISSDEEHTFTDEQSLLQWLRQICEETELDRNATDLAPGC